MVFVRVAAVVDVQAAALSGQGSLGNYNPMQKAKILCCDDSRKACRIVEVPVITGNALKHWHACYTAKIYELELGGRKISEYCRMCSGVRGYITVNGGNRLAKDEVEAIREDVCNDLHGFLIAAPGEGGGGGRSQRRDSLVKFSFGLPVDPCRGDSETYDVFVSTHNRVDPTGTAGGKEQTQMMVFKREYSSLRVGFIANLDLHYIMKPLFEKPREQGSGEDREEVKKRAKAAILAFRHLLQFQVGARQAAALPAARPVEFVAVVSDCPLPSLPHPIYSDWSKHLGLASTSAGSGCNVVVYAYPESLGDAIRGGEGPASVKASSDIGELIKMLADEVARRMEEAHAGSQRSS